MTFRTVTEIRVAGPMTFGGRSGFTLVELLVVLAVLSLLALFVMPYVTNIMPKARTDTARIQVERLMSTLDVYYLDLGRFPSTDEGLGALTKRPENATSWRGPYVRTAASLIDPWGHPYQYRSPGTQGEYDLFSFGADGKEGGDGVNADVATGDASSK